MGRQHEGENVKRCVSLRMDEVECRLYSELGGVLGLDLSNCIRMLAKEGYSLVRMRRECSRDFDRRSSRGRV